MKLHALGEDRLLAQLLSKFGGPKKYLRRSGRRLRGRDSTSSGNLASS